MSTRLLEAAVSGKPERPLLAPLISAAAAELQGLGPRAFLQDVTKLTNGLRDLTLSLAADVATVEFGTSWDAEAQRVGLHWSPGQSMPRRHPMSVLPEADFATRGRAPGVLEAIRRLRVLLQDRALVAAGVTGPVTLTHLIGARSPTQTVPALLSAVRLLCDAGAQLIWVVEGPEAPSDPDGLGAAMTPVWGTIRFYQALGALHLSGEADAWLPFVALGGANVPCFDPDRAPAIASRALSNGTPFGLALPPGVPTPTAKKLARTGRCLVLTHDNDLAGRVAVRDLLQTVGALGSLLS
jgi:hypothetical protein